MDCKTSSEIMMKYLDTPLDINAKKAEKFHKHLEKCDACREDFNAYNDIFESLLAGDMEQPPLDFEDCVMEKILAFELTPTADKRVISFENVSVIVSTVVSVLIGVYFMYAMSSDASGVVMQSQSISAQLNNIAAMAADFLNKYQYALFAVACALLLLQSKIRNRFFGKITGEE